MALHKLYYYYSKKCVIVFLQIYLNQELQCVKYGTLLLQPDTV